MSALVFVAKRGAGDWPQGLVAALRVALHQFGPDESSLEVRESYIAGFGAQHTTRKCPSEHMLILEEDCPFLVDARVDNRSELLGELQNCGFSPRDGTDAEFVYQCYRCWGPRCQSKLYGTVSFIAWDTERGRLVASRGWSDSSPLYYHVDRELIVCGTFARLILSHPEVSRALDPLKFGLDCTAVSYFDQSRTPFESVRALPDMRCLEGDFDGVEVADTWTFPCTNKLVYADPREYERHLVSLLDRAVDDRINVDQGLACDLSGGLDSSALVAWTRKRLTAAGRNPDELRVFSTLYTGQPYDESPWIDSLQKHCGLDLRRVEAAPPGSVTDTWSVAEEWDLPHTPARMVAYNRMTAMRDEGIRVCFTGNGPDIWLTGAKSLFYDLLLEGRFRSILEQSRHLYRIDSLEPVSPVHALRSIAREIIPQWFHDWRRPRLNHGAWRRRNLSSSIRGRMTQAEIFRKDRPAFPFRNRTNQAMYLRGNAGVLGGFRRDAFRWASRFGMRRLSPLDDQRIAEFALCLPLEYLQWNGVTKVLFRRVVSPLLPAIIAERKNKTFITLASGQALRTLPNDEYLAKVQRLQETGWIDREAMDAFRGFAESDFGRSDQQGGLAYIDLCLSLRWADLLELHGMSS